MLSYKLTIYFGSENHWFLYQKHIGQKYATFCVKLVFVKLFCDLTNQIIVLSGYCIASEMPLTYNSIEDCYDIYFHQVVRSFNEFFIYDTVEFTCDFYEKRNLITNF